MFLHQGNKCVIKLGGREMKRRMRMSWSYLSEPHVCHISRGVIRTHVCWRQ